MKSLNKINLIITDDNPAFVEALRFFLSKFDVFEIIAVCRNGLDLINNNNLPNADLLLVDIEMPEMDGLEAAGILKTRYPDLPLIAVTMHQDQILVKEIMNAGFNGVAYKAEVGKNLVNSIEKVLSDSYDFPVHSN